MGWRTAVEKIEKTDVNDVSYSHTYSSVGNYTIKITGKASGYNTGVSVASIEFSSSVNKNAITSATGNMGQVFPYHPVLD